MHPHLAWLDIAGLVEAQHRNAFTDRERKVRRDRDQLRVVGAQHQARLGQWADQHFECADVDLVAALASFGHWSILCWRMIQFSAIMRYWSAAPVPPFAISNSARAISVSARSRN